MRLFRVLGVLSVLTLLVLSSSSAGQGHGAAIFRGNDGWLWWFDWNEGNLAVYASEPNFDMGFCGGPQGEWIFMDYKGVWVPPQKQNYQWGGAVYTRLYPGVDPGALGWDFTNTEFLCTFLQTAAPAAWGISEFKHTDIDTCNLGPGRNTWSDRVHGLLQTPKTVCSSGMAKHDLVLKWMLPLDAYVDPSCAVDSSLIKLVVAQGPALKCIGK